ncbi:NEDD8-conjugating enzyme Ubc12 [Binucleata daphniae]
MVYFADFRLQNELKNINLPKNCVLNRLDETLEKYHCTFLVKFDIKDGVYKNRKFDFKIHVHEEYPFKPPKIKCLTYIFHPNIESGHVCMNIIREDWSSAYGLEIIIQSLYTLFFTFESEDAMNVRAGEMIKNDFDAFIKETTSEKENTEQTKQ